MSTVTTTYLEMNAQSEFVERTDAKGLEVIEAEIKEYRFNRYLYSLIGERWNWTEKRDFTDLQWEEYAESSNLRTWVAYY